jgi:hypothetical protein
MSVNSPVVVLRSASAPLRLPVKNSSISSTRASVSPTKNKVVVAGEYDELGVGDVLG